MSEGDGNRAKLATAVIWRVPWSIGRLSVGSLPRFIIVPIFIVAANVVRHGNHSTVARVVAVVTMLLLLASLRAFTRLTIGEDGIAVTTPFSRTFVAFRDLLAIRRWPSVRGHEGSNGVDLVLRDRYPLRLYTRTGTMSHPDNDVVPVMQEAFKRYQAAQRLEEGSTLLAREGRDVRAWAEDLTRLGANVASYRERPLEKEELVAIVEASTATPQVRVAAAFALTAAPQGQQRELRQRVRVAAQAVASPELRQALVEVTEEDDEDQRLDGLRRVV